MKPQYFGFMQRRYKMFYKVPVNDGMLDINYEDLLEAVQISEVEAYVKLNDNADLAGNY